MPVDWSKYPANWQSVRRKILHRAGGDDRDPRVGACCEWCGLRNYAVGYRDNGDFRPIKGNLYIDLMEYATSYREARELADHANDWGDGIHRYIVVVLTIAHVHDPNPQNVNSDNLAALCQQCHIRWDVRQRRERRRIREGLPLQVEPLH